MKLHLGCGKRYLEGYIHVDIAEFEHIDYQLPVDDLSSFKSDTVEEIYASHVIEYFDRVEIIEVLNKWKSKLKSGGTLRLAVPDFEAMAKLYIEKNIPLNNFLGPLYGKMKMGKDFIFHKTTYDFDSLKELLNEVGFRNMDYYLWQETEHGIFDDHSQAYIPHMDKENGTLISLNIEVKK